MRRIGKAGKAAGNTNSGQAEAKITSDRKSLEKERKDKFKDLLRKLYKDRATWKEVFGDQSLKEIMKQYNRQNFEDKAAKIAHELPFKDTGPRDDGVHPGMGHPGITGFEEKELSQDGDKKTLGQYRWNSETHASEIDINKGTIDTKENRETVYHEVGHNVYFNELSEEDRENWGYFYKDNFDAMPPDSHGDYYSKLWEDDYEKACRYGLNEFRDEKRAEKEGFAECYRAFQENKLQDSEGHKRIDHWFRDHGFRRGNEERARSIDEIFR